MLDARTWGYIAIAVAVGSLFICAPLAPFVAIVAAAFAIVAIRGGAKGLGIAALVVAVITVIVSAAMMYDAYRTVEQAGKELEQWSKELESKCFVCGGKGWNDCPFCVNGRTSLGTCPFCNGWGRTTCTICNGTGKGGQ